MKLNVDSIKNRELWTSKGYSLPAFDRDIIKTNTSANPTWIHFGAGNIFRAFPAALLQKLLNNGDYGKGVIVAEGFDYEIIDKAYDEFDSLSVLVTLKSNGTIEKSVIGSVTESIRANFDDIASFDRLKEIFTSPTLQMVTFTITEKGYAVHSPDGDILKNVKADFEKKALYPDHLMGKVTVLLYQRYLAGKYPIAMSSMDNCSHNGDKLHEGVMCYAENWVKAGLMDAGFIDYLSDENCVTFPWSMIDKITPRPDAKVKKILEEDGFEDADTIITSKNTYTSAFVNTEEAEYLIIEDKFPNGRPPLEKAGVLYADRETVDKIEKMKVCTCLNPLHTALAIYGCLLGYKTIWEEMRDKELVNLINKMGYGEGMPVVVDPGIIKPEDFIREVLEIRLPNPFMPDAPQRIATDTSQKLPIRFGETLKAYISKGKDISGLKFIPLVYAGYLRYLMAVDDEGNAFEPSSDPLLDELMEHMKAVKLGDTDVDMDVIRPILSRSDIFPVDLFKYGLAEKINGYLTEMISEKGAIRKTLIKYCD